MSSRIDSPRTRMWAGLNLPNTDKADISIAGLPYDGAACSRPGASGGPSRIRVLSSEIPPMLETGECLKNIIVRDGGDIPFGDDFVASFPDIEREVRRFVRQSFLLTLGGDHSIAIPVHRAFSRMAEKKIGLIFIDAHTDLSDRFQGSSYSNACPLRRTLEEEQFSPDATVLIGTRCFEPEGLQYIEKHRIKVFPAYEVADCGMQEIASKVVSILRGFSNVYLSIDIDVLDPAFAPGTGIPDAGGLTTRDLITLIRLLDPLPVVGADLVEVAPALDVSDITSFAALRIVMEIVGLVSRRKLRGLRFTLQ